MTVRVQVSSTGGTYPRWHVTFTGGRGPITFRTRAEAIARAELIAASRRRAGHDVIEVYA